jgi:hypothetical protein
MEKKIPNEKCPDEIDMNIILVPSTVRRVI